MTEKQCQKLNGVGKEQVMLGSVILDQDPKRSGLKHLENANNQDMSMIPISDNRISSPKGKKYADITVRYNKRFIFRVLSIHTILDVKITL